MSDMMWQILPQATSSRLVTIWLGAVIQPEGNESIPQAQPLPSIPCVPIISDWLNLSEAIMTGSCCSSVSNRHFLPVQHSCYLTWLPSNLHYLSCLQDSHILTNSVCYLKFHLVIFANCFFQAHITKLLDLNPPDG